MKEDNLTNKIIKKRDLDEKHYNELTEDITVESEVHYNYYGTRGVADLLISKQHRKTRGQRVLKQTKQKDHVIEIKNNPSNANKVLRQFNKMKKYFYKDEERVRPENYKFELSFIATRDNYKHVLENKEMYLLADKKKNSFVSFRSIEDVKPVPISDRVDKHIGSEGWKEMLKLNNEKIYENLFKEEK